MGPGSTPPAPDAGQEVSQLHVPPQELSPGPRSSPCPPPRNHAAVRPSSRQEQAITINVSDSVFVKAEEDVQNYRAALAANRRALHEEEIRREKIRQEKIRVREEEIREEENRIREEELMVRDELIREEKILDHQLAELEEIKQIQAGRFANGRAIHEAELWENHDRIAEMEEKSKQMKARLSPQRRAARQMGYIPGRRRGVVKSQKVPCHPMQTRLKSRINVKMKVDVKMELGMKMELE
jgi:hypothetical protein